MLWLINDLTRCFNYELRNVDGKLSWIRTESVEEKENKVEGMASVVTEGNSSKGVSEPVISFVKEFKSNTGRFIINTSWDCGTVWWVYDKECKLSYLMKKSLSWENEWYLTNTYFFRKNIIIKNLQDTSWLTREERDYLYKELIEKWHNVRKERFKQLKEIRQRRKLKKLYVKEEK